MILRDVGDRIAVRYESRDTNSVLTDATLVLTVTDPSGAITTPSVTHTSTGLYDSSIDLSLVGKWRWKWTASGAIVDVAYGEVDAQNPSIPQYAPLSDLKSFLRIPQADTTDDVELLSRLASGQSQVEGDCGRRFWQDSVTSQRLYRPTSNELLEVDDIATVTGLIVEIGSVGGSFSVVSANDYDLLPENSIADNRPIEFLRRLSGAWPVGFFGFSRRMQVRVTAKWGWPIVPEDIKNATILKAARLFRRKDSPEGIRGFSDFGIIRVTRYDPDYDNFIKDYVKGGV